MRRKVIVVTLSMCLVFAFFGVLFAFAGENTSNLIISDKSYEIAPDILEREYITNNNSLTAQQSGHVMEVKLGGNAQIIAGYNDYNIETIKSGKNWSMRKTTEQAQAAETRRGVNVVGAVNGDFFDMSNGRPRGALVMNGTAIQQGDFPCFYIDADDVPHISDTASTMPKDVKEAIGGAAVLVADGKQTDAADETKNPRTAIGIKADHSVIIYMVDGRQAPLSVGMSYSELAQTMIDLGCVWALNLDGGGSSTFATQRAGEDNSGGSAGLTMRCSPSDGYERTVSSSLLVVSSASSDGKFDHAILSPKEEVYTPGNTIKFTAQGADKSGAAAELPKDGLSWEVLGGTALGTIDETTGVFHAAEGKTGAVTVVLNHNGLQVGKTKVELQWPDKLGFTNNSISLDFGESSDLSFAPTWKGQKVHYKDGDFSWSLDPKSYKFTTSVEKYYYPGWMPAGANHWNQLQLVLTGTIGETKSAQYRNDSYVLYQTKYEETSRTIDKLNDGTVQVTESVTHKGADIFSHIDGSQLHSGVTEDIAEKVEGIKKTAEYSFPIGRFGERNQFIADKNNSLNGTVHVALKNNSGVGGSVDVIVGMEPYMLMNFEDHVNADGTRTDASEYWKMHVGASSNSVNGNGQLTLEEMRDTRLWIRDTTSKGVIWPEGQNGIVSASEDSNVRFGEYACRLGWDYTKIDKSIVASADFGFSAALHVDLVQPTKLGVWINVPKDLSGDDSVLKAILVGNSGVTNSEGLAYSKMQEDGSMELVENQNITGTTTYFQYFSYNSDGSVSGSKLSDWAGKGWTWVEADISSLQMPVGVQRGYSVRITSPQNCTKGKGHIYIDNLQMIYGTNTNDVNNPIIESVVEKGSGVNLKTVKEKPTFSTEKLTFDVPISDNVTTDKYASGIDSNSIRVYIDGRDYTEKAEITSNLSGNTILLSTEALTNGEHSIKLRVKDYFGNESIESYSFYVSDEEGKDAEVSVKARSGDLNIGGTFALDIVNQGEADADGAVVTVEVPESYLEAVKNHLDNCITYGDTYEAAEVPKAGDGKITVSVKKKTGGAHGEIIASLQFNLPENAKEGDCFTYAVPEGRYVINGTTKTFSMSEQKIPLAASYKLTAGKAIAGIETEFKVTDNKGKEVKEAAIYDSEGTELSNPYTFDTGGRKTIYAQTKDNKRSWNLDIVVSEPGKDGDGKPFGIQNNASENGAVMRQITWLSAIGESSDKAYIRYSENKSEVESAAPADGESDLITFAEANSGDAYRINSVKLTDLKPKTTYYYQVGDGKNWSDTLSFTTAPDRTTEETNFFIFGDIQSDDTANLSAAIKQVTGAEKPYAFGVQTGDAIDNVGRFSNWRGYLTTMNGNSLGGIDIIHTLGNHEYYGDAEGKISGAMYGLPESSQGSFYSVEYGSVYVAVVNNGGNLQETLEQVKMDAAKSSCSWKVLTLHEPIYGTNEEMDADRRLEVTKIIEDTGFDFVFSGDDHAYARTYPMSGDKALAADSRDGVIYYVCGDLSGKDNAYHPRDYFAASMPHADYGGMYLSAAADHEKLTINAYKYDGTLLDSFTRSKSDCELGNHKFDETSRYDTGDKTLTCIVCGEKIAASDSKYTGKVTTADETGQVVLAAGVVKTGWFTWLEDICHAGEDGILHETKTEDTATCTEDGHLISTCECGETYKGAYTYSKGHTWDADHVCTVCGTKGISMSEVKLTLKGQYWEYTGSAVRAKVIATYGDYTLNAKGDRNGRDAYISYSNNTDVGMGKVTLDGRGDYYGTKSIDFPIVPQSVTTIASGNIMSTAVTLKWDAAKGADYYRIYKKTAGSAWEHVGNTESPNMIVTGLQPDTKYTFRVASSADIDGKKFNGLHWSNELQIETAEKTTGSTEEKVERITAAIDVNGKQIEIPMTTTDKGNYLLLPASADLTALKCSLKADGADQTATYTGVNASQEADGNTAVDITALTGNTSVHSHEIMVSLPDCDPMKLCIKKSAKLPSIYLTSDDAESKGRSYVDASKSNAVTAKMAMQTADGSMIYDGNLKQLKARGNSTFKFYEKKSYQIKLSTPSDLLGTGENVKTFVLLAGYGDATQMHDKLFKDLAAEMNMSYVASCDWVDLYYDGEYRGTYLLSEKNSVGSTGVDITDMEELYEAANESYGDNAQIETDTNAYGQTYQFTAGLNTIENISGGYLIERNLKEIDEASGFYTKQGGGFNVKSPEFADEKAMKYISEYYQEFEDAVYAQDQNGNYTGYNEKTGKRYDEYCDVESLVKVFLLQELALNPDGFLSSFYFYKDADGIMYAGPIWDQEMALGTGWTVKIGANVTSYHYLAEALIQIPSFKAAVEKYYQETFSDLTKKLIESNGTVSGYQDKLTASADMNYVMWPYVRIGSPSVSGHLWPDGTSYRDVVKDMTQWIQVRLQKLNVLFGDGSEHTEHSYTSKVTKEPTYSEEGERTYTCTVCGYSYTETIEKLAPPSGGGAVVPDTRPDEQEPSEKTISMEEVEKLAGKDNASLSVLIGKVEFSFGNKALSAILKESKGDKLYISVKDIEKSDQSAEEKSAAGKHGQILKFKVSFTGGEIKDFDGGQVTVTVPIPDGLKKEEVCAMCIDENGTYSVAPGEAVTKDGKDYYIFRIKKLSSIAITDEKTANALIKEQKNQLIKQGVQKTNIAFKSSKTAGGIRLTWAKSKGYKVDYYQIFRSTKKNSGYGKKPFYTTKDSSKNEYVNTKKLKKGVRYYYKVRGVRMIDGKKYYTKWSNKAWRTAK